MNTQDFTETINALTTMSYKQLFLFVLISAVGNGVINVIITHMLYGRRLKKEQIMRGEEHDMGKNL